MSLIIAYIGKKGCVMASDKRKIAYFGDKENREKLEESLYDGTITTDDELIEKAASLDVSLKISDDGNKIKTIGDVVMGEVTTKGTFETKRKRIYGTTNGYQLIEIIGSKINSRTAGERGIIIFGNKFAKAKAEKLISKKFKSTLSLKYMGEIFEEILKEVSAKTPSVGNEFDVLIKQPDFSYLKAQQYLDRTIDKDIKLLTKFREKLQKDLIEKTKEIELASKIITEGDIGKVSSVDGNIIEVQLNKKTQAFDSNWKQLAKPNENVIMFTDSEDVKVGDKVVIENDNLCLKKDKSSLRCDIILCSL